MPPLTLDRLQDIAGRPDTGLRMGADKSGTEEREGSWGGRVMRNLKAATGAVREAQRTGYRLAKVAVLQALIDAYGKEIGIKAFRAGVGRPLGEKGWQTSADHPVTGRHVERMLREAGRLAPGSAVEAAGRTRSTSRSPSRATGWRSPSARRCRSRWSCRSTTTVSRATSWRWP